MPRSNKPTLSGLARRLDRRLGGVGRHIGPAGRLARIDMTVLKAWGGNIRAVDEALGPSEADAYTELVLVTARRDAETARQLAYTLPDHLARVTPAQRNRYLALLRTVLEDGHQALPLVVRTLPDLLDRLDDASIAQYLARGVQLHGESRRKAESFLKLESGQGLREVEQLRRGLLLDGIKRTLGLYARAHCGGDVEVKVGDHAFTDGRHIYLPRVVDHFNDDRDRLVYRVLTARNAGYIEFDTLDVDVEALPGTWPGAREGELAVERLCRSFVLAPMARDLFSLFETRRVECRVRSEYPGVARDMDELAQAWRPPRPELDGLAPAELAIECLARVATGLTVELDALDEPVRRVVEDLLALLPAVEAPGAVAQTSAEQLLLAYALVDGLMRRAEPGEPPPGDEREGGSSRSPGLAGSEGTPGDDSDEPEYQPMRRDPTLGDLRAELMSTEERSVEERARQLLERLREHQADATLADARSQARREGSSYEEMADFLDRNPAPAGPLREQEEHRAISVWDEDSKRIVDALDHEGDTRAGVFLYPEWDAHIGDHKPDWVRLTEYVLSPGSTAFVDEVRRRHGPLIAQVRRAFEALRPESMRMVRGLVDGDEIDLDKAIEAIIDRRIGGVGSERIYSSHRRDERDVAVAFLVDMSSSTNEVANSEAQRIIDVEKEALVLIAEAVDAIGDACAIYGFSGYGRDQVAFYIAKDFDDRWDERVRERIGRISWKMENRDGAAIRHATHKLAGVPSRVKLLLLLSDGKPLDCGCEQYADRYAQEDTRQALAEARKKGVHPFCITVDPRGQEYLARMYGDVGYTVIDRVEALPVRLPQIYRRLTR